MNKFLLVPLLFSVVLSGCGEHDLTYYQSNLDDAEAKFSECTREIKAAFMSGDEDGLKSVSEDQECKFAEQAIKEHKKKLAKLEREAAKEKFKAELADQLALLASAPYEEFAAISTECGFITSTPRCKAYKQLEKQRLDDEVKLLLDKHSGSELEALHKPCAGTWPSTASCNLSNAALKSAIDTQVSYFVEHREQLVTAFNVCQKEIVSLNRSNKYQEGAKVASKFKCSTASTAAQKLGVYGFSNPIKI